MLWNAQHIAAAIGGKAQGNWEVTGISIDSRTVKTGDLFIALEGERFDGHEYVAKALEDGATGAIISKPVARLANDAPTITVQNCFDALSALAAAARERMHGRVAAITGSVGKTSTRAMLMRALSAGGDVHATEGNLNNHIGTPLSLARMPEHVPYAVFELGMNHAGEIEPLSKLAQPDVAIITNVEPVHLEFFDGIEGIAHAKAEIFSGVKPGGTVLLNQDNNQFPLLEKLAKAAGVQIMRFGESPDADAQLLSHAPEGWGAAVEADINGETIAYHLQHPGKFHAINSLSVLAAAKTMGIPLAAAAKMLQEWQPEPGRGQHMLLSDNNLQVTLIDDSYNASPASVRTSLEVLSALPGRRVVVLGDMLELGDDAPALHAALAKDIAQAEVDVVYAAGALMKNLSVALPDSIAHQHFADADALLQALPDALQNGDTLLVKGSHGSRMYAVVDHLRRHFNGMADPVSDTQRTAHVL